MTDPDPERWTCQWCRVVYPVPSLARDCEDQHETDTAPNQETQ